MTARAQKMPAARQVLDKAMSEEELLVAITDALTVYGWRWSHSRRSDKALTMGHPGVPDIIAARRGHVLFIELKSEIGRQTSEQWAWELAIPAKNFRFWRPSDLDAALRDLA